MGLKNFWFEKVWVGQIITEKGREEMASDKFTVRYRKELAMYMPAVFVWICYFAIMFYFAMDFFNTPETFSVWFEKFCPSGAHDEVTANATSSVTIENVTTTSQGTTATPSSEYYIGCPDNGINRWYMSLVMIAGGMVAGATSEGAGAIAFPVMTLVLKLTPVVARDFSVMSQSVGMPAAMFTIFYLKVQLVQLHVIITASLAGFLGLAVGMEYIAPMLTPPYVKMWFAVIWASFAMALYKLNATEGRTVFDKIPSWDDSEYIRISMFRYNRHLVVNWRTFVIIISGFIGGIFTALAGNGMDICCFSTLTLLFRVNEKTATPTSVVLMAINTMAGFAYRVFFQGGVDPEAWRFLAVSAPIVVLAAPIGSWIGSNLSRECLAFFIYLIDAVQLIGAILIVQPWHYSKWLIISSIIWTIIAIFTFWYLSKKGLDISDKIMLSNRKKSMKYASCVEGMMDEETKTWIDEKGKLTAVADMASKNAETVLTLQVPNQNQNRNRRRSSITMFHNYQ